MRRGKLRTRGACFEGPRETDPRRGGTLQCDTYRSEAGAQHARPDRLVTECTDGRKRRGRNDCQIQCSTAFVARDLRTQMLFAHVVPATRFRTSTAQGSWSRTSNSQAAGVAEVRRRTGAQEHARRSQDETDITHFARHFWRQPRQRCSGAGAWESRYRWPSVVPSLVLESRYVVRTPEGLG